MNVTRPLSRGLHTICDLVVRSPDELEAMSKSLRAAILSANGILIPDYRVHLKLSPSQVVLAQKTDNYCLLQLNNLTRDVSCPIGIFNAKLPSKGFDPFFGISAQLFRFVVQHLLAEKQPESYLISSFGTKLDLRSLPPEDRSLLKNEMVELLETLASTTIVRAIKIENLIYFFDDEDIDPNATAPIPVINQKDRKVSFISVSPEIRQIFKERLAEIKKQQPEELKKILPLIIH